MWSFDVSGRSKGRLLAGLVSYGHTARGTEPFEESRTLDVLGILAAELLASRKASEQWVLLLSGRAWAEALERRAVETLARERARHALGWFDESALVNLDGAAFARLADAEAARREARVFDAMGWRGAADAEAYLQTFRRRLLATTLWEKSVRSLPALFLLGAAAVALALLLRVLKLPS